MTFFSNGRDLPELHQVFAAGHGLVLSSYWPGSFMYDIGITSNGSSKFGSITRMR